LHIFVPESSWRQAWYDAVVSPLAVGGAALVVAAILAVAIAGRVTHPLRRLGSEVDKIAHGDFRTVPLPRRNDELRDLAVAVDRMAQTLARYEQQIRRSERLQTLAQLGGGMAHQIRNSATGCRMAVDLLARDLPEAGRSEHLKVARRQLQLMEEYLGRLLTLGRGSSELDRDELNLTNVVEDALKLVKPAARHVRVEVEFLPPAEPPLVRGDHDALQQLLVNLLINAVDAAKQPQTDRPAPSAGGDEQRVGRVEVSLSGDEDGRAILEVRDSGAGPSADMAKTLFEPLVTDKPDGTGLGLTVAREIAEQHDGSIRCERRGEMTCFVVELPTTLSREAAEGE
jgi:signal transduction histidine kinase